MLTNDWAHSSFDLTVVYDEEISKDLAHSTSSDCGSLRQMAVYSLFDHFEAN